MTFIFVEDPNDIDKAVKAHKLDRRFKYNLYGNTLVYTVKLTEACTGCNEHGEYEIGPTKGNGCHECGYTGKRVNYYPCHAEAKDGVTEFTKLHP